jgi:hypothetical protein
MVGVNLLSIILALDAKGSGFMAELEKVSFFLRNMAANIFWWLSFSVSALFILRFAKVKMTLISKTRISR